MRPIQSVLVPLVFLTALIGAAAAENVCVQGADGTIVCGPIAQRSNGANPSPDASPFDQPGVAQPIAPPPPVAERKPPHSRPVHEAERNAPPPKHVYRQPPPRDFERRPPPRQIAREDERRLHTERSHEPPLPRVDRVRTARYSDTDLRQFDERRERPMTRVERDDEPRRYESRLRELEREVHLLRADRDAALHHDRYAVSQRTSHRRVDRDRNSDND